METSDLIIAILVILLVFCFFGHLLIIHTNNIDQNQPNTITQYKKIYVPVPVPQPQPWIGGCSGTQYGCCIDGITAKHDSVGSNCSLYPPPPPPPPPHLIGGCSGTRYGCCNDGITAKHDDQGLNCPI